MRSEEDPMLIVKTYDLRSLRRGGPDSETTGLYGFKTTLTGEDGRQHDGWLYVDGAATITCGSIQCSIRELYDFLNSHSHTLELTPVPYDAGDNGPPCYYTLTIPAEDNSSPS